MKEKKTESVKINLTTLSKVRNHVIKTGQTISGYIDVVIKNDLNNFKKNKK